MKAKISIDCEDTDELIAHLQVMISQVKKERKEFPDKEINQKVRLRDNNCYGIHDLIITP